MASPGDRQGNPALYGGMPEGGGPPGMAPRLLEFADELRKEGVAVGTSELLDAFRALDAVAWTSREDFREALAATLAKSQEDRHVLDVLFDRFFFRAVEREAVERGLKEERFEGAEDLDLDALRERIRDAIRAGSDGEMRDLARLAIAAFGRQGEGSGVIGVDVQRIRRTLGLKPEKSGTELMDPDAVPRDGLQEFEQHVRRELERQMIERTRSLPPAKPLREFDRALPSNPAQDLSQVHRVVSQLKKRLASHGREHRGRRRSWQVDVRRTMRASLQTGGVPLELKYRPRRPRRPELYVLCDVSTSVTSASVFFLSVLHALHDQFRKLRSFVFVERISEVTDVFERERSFAAVSRRIATDAGVADVSGYTDYGRVWLEFLDKVVDDLDREIIERVPEFLDLWGTHPSWSRLLGSPVLYEQIEERLTALLGSEDSLVLPTITHIHMSVIPLLAASGTIFLDARAHKTIYDGCQIAKARGAAVRRFRFEDPGHLDQLLSQERDPTRLVCLDGVNSMTGNAPDLQAFAAVTRRHGALLYVDDAHGFGVIGERSPIEPSPYGVHGNSIVRHADETYDNLVLVAGFSKAYSSLLAFIACPTDVKDLLKVAATPYLYSGPSPVASLATVLAGFDVNEARGDAIRADLWRKAAQVLECIDRLGAHTPNRSGFPLVEVPLARHEDVGEVGRFLFENGIYVTLASYPLVPKNEVGFRIQITAANTNAEIEQLVDVLGKLAARFDLQAARTEEVAA